jgi:hypothetical protein
MGVVAREGPPEGNLSQATKPPRIARMHAMATMRAFEDI